MKPPRTTPSDGPAASATLSGSADGSLTQLATGIGYATAASGVGLAVLPSLVLRLLGTGRAVAPAPFLFRIVGMFMVVSGGRSPRPSARVSRVRWPGDGRWRPRSAPP